MLYLEGLFHNNIFEDIVPEAIEKVNRIEN